MANTKTIKVTPTGITTILPGSYPLPSTLIPDGKNFVVLEIARCTTATPTVWPDEAVTVSMQLEASFDGGNQWVKAGFCSAVGGIVPNKKNNLDGAKTTMRVAWPLGIDRRIRGELIVAGGPCHTNIAIEVT